MLKEVILVHDWGTKTITPATALGEIAEELVPSVNRININASTWVATIRRVRTRKSAGEKESTLHISNSQVEV